MRNIFKYGDQFFVRDPETKKLFHIDPAKLTKIIVNESEGKKPEQYVIKDFNLNFAELVATTPFQTNGNVTGGGDGYLQGGVRGMVGNTTTSTAGGRFQLDQTNEIAIDAENVVHLSLSEGLDLNYPFGNSLLETVFKVFKQKELLEDAIIIYRVQRAPERRIFKIDVGNMPSHMAMSFVERIKNEVHQRRIPTQTGGGQNMMDATYNPLSTNEDFFFPVTADGRGSTVETLAGGSNLGEITDLHFFTNKLFRGLRIPSSYLPTGLDDGTTQQNTFSDGRVGTALIQELRFNQYCMRLQRLIAEKIDQEFKVYMRWKGINIDSNLFQLRFREPQNFAAYRQVEVDTARISTFTQLESFPYLSKRFLMTRYLGMTEEEVKENERMWREEQGDMEKAPSEDVGLRGVGISPGTIQGDLETTMPTAGGEINIGGDGGETAVSTEPTITAPTGI